MPAKSQSVKTVSTRLIALALVLISLPSAAHVSEQGFVLLLPTGVYITGGVLAVVLTVVLLGFVSDRQASRLFHSRSLWTAPELDRWQTLSSLLSFCVLLGLILVGLTGSRDPLSNPFPLFIWTLWWIGFVSLQGIAGDLWRWINPWMGLYKLITPGIKPARATLPERLGIWPATCLFVAFIAFSLADTSPDDPARLAIVVSAYYLFTLAGMWLCGAEIWLSRVECFSVLLRYYAMLAPLARKTVRLETVHQDGAWRGDDQVLASQSLPAAQSSRSPNYGYLQTPHHSPGRMGLGLPGWAACYQASALHDDRELSDAVLASVGVFILVVLACGSFDGINETFWWLSLIDINPLEYPGRSAVVTETLVGLLLANVTLLLVFSCCVVSGLWLASRGTDAVRVSYLRAFGTLAVGILPIAFAYHIAHYLTAFMVNAQYALAAVSDPLHTGADYLGLGTFYVTTGFFNTHHTVQIIWLTQAGVVVAGHVLSVLLTHALAVKLLGTGRRAVISQLPLALFMILYTLLGLWLLASPRGA